MGCLSWRDGQGETSNVSMVTSAAFTASVGSFSSRDSTPKHVFPLEGKTASRYEFEGHEIILPKAYKARMLSIA